MNIGKALSIAAAFAISTSGFAASMDSRVSNLEKEMKQVRTETATGTYGGLTASARAEVDGKGWSLMLGPIYQHARVNGTEFAYTDDDPSGSLPINGRTKDVDFDWDWGIKAAIGYNFEHDLWDIKMTYTWLDTSGSKSSSAGFNSSLIALKGSSTILQGCGNFGSSAEFVFSTSAKSQFDLVFHDLVLDLGRDYFISGWLALRPHVGLQSDWIYQEQVVRYTGGTESGGPGVPIGHNTVQITDDSDYWGLGPMAGVDSNWYLGAGFSLFGNASGALLYGRSDVIHHEQFSLCPHDNKIRIVADRHHFVPTTNLQLGLSYERYFDDHGQHIGLRLGYEAQYFWRANQMLNIEDSSTLKYDRLSEDVARHGIMLDARWTF